MVSSFAAMALLYTLFSKLVPLISVWELNSGQHSNNKVAARVEDVQTAGELT